MTKFYQRALMAAAACAFTWEVALAQTPAAPQDAVLKTWARTYGSPSPYEGLFDLRRAPDGTLHVAGYTSSFGTSSSSGWLLHLDHADGAVGNQSVVSSTLGDVAVVDGAGLAADGGALFTGRIVLDLFVKHDAWLVRVDELGDPLWWRGFTRTGFGRYFLLDAAQVDSGSWVVAGTSGVIDEPPQRGWVVRMSATGDVVWQYEYGGGIADHLQSVTPTSDGGVAVAGWTNSSGAGSDDAWIMKLDSTGAIEWQRTFGGSDIDQATGIIELEAGGFAVAARTGSFTASGNAPWVLRLDAQGDLLWHRIADGVWGDLHAIAETSGGGVIAHGRVGEPGFPSNDLWAIELAPNGEVRWQRAYEGASGDWGSAVLALPGSGFVLGGFWGWGFPEEDLWVVRTGRAGRLSGCGLDRSTSFPLTSPQLVMQPGTAVRQPGQAIDRPLDFTSAASDADVVERCH